MKPLELWGGIECTVNRVGDAWIDQLAMSGHGERDDDIDRLAALGIRTWRYPLLWERLAPRGVADIDWTAPDRQMGRMAARGLDPIIGLLHHGSGPGYTSLLDPDFPRHLADYARAVAQRYPWVRRWTPLNEPLSTARFSGLDGHWFPHHTSAGSFARAVVNECQGIVRAMHAIREVNPAAELVFTEDVCRHTATPRLQAEADFRNHRRFLPLDLVVGRVRPGHALYDWLTSAGISPDELTTLSAAATPPSVIGANYYVTSDRFLDEEPSRVPKWRRFDGPDGLYGETESVRVSLAGIVGHRALLQELWLRYRLPVAITEVHLGCTREEQVRWLLEAWDAAALARTDGVDVRAVTAWGAFGLFGWDELVVRANGTYEPGLFDVRSTPPRPTALARVAADLAAGRPPDAPWGGPGWWRRPARLLGRQPIAVKGALASRPLPAVRPARPLLVTGSGAMAREVFAACRLRGLQVAAPGRSLDVGDPDAVASALDDLRPWAVFHAAGMRDRRSAERDPALTARLHASVPEILALECSLRDIRLATLSSSLVLPPGMTHDEGAARAPRGVLGHAQADGEERILKHYPAALVLRTGVVVGLGRDDDFLAAGLAALRDRGEWLVPTDASGIVGGLLAHAGLDLLEDAEAGIWHLAHRRPLHEIARAVARHAGLDASRIREEHPPGARLASTRGAVVPSCAAALRALAAQRAATFALQPFALQPFALQR